MPIAFMGSTREDFEVTSNVEVLVRGESGGVNDNRLGEGMNMGLNMGGSGPYARTRFKMPLKNYWFKCDVSAYQTGFGASEHSLYIGKSTIFPVASVTPIRIRILRGINDAANDVQLYVNGTMVAQANVPVSTNVSTMRYDVRIVNDPVNGLIQIYANTILVLQYTGNTSHGLENHDYFNIQNENGGRIIWSGFLITTTDTRIFRMQQLTLDGNGSFQDWEGEYTDINETTANNNTFISSNEPGAVSTFHFTKPTPPEGYNIAGIVLNAIASVYGPVATDIITVYYDGSNLVEMGPYNVDDVVFGGNMLIAEVDPATGVRFTPEQLAVLEFGFKLPEAA